MKKRDYDILYGSGEKSNFREIFNFMRFWRWNTLYSIEFDIVLIYDERIDFKNS